MTRRLTRAAGIALVLAAITAAGTGAIRADDSLGLSFYPPAIDPAQDREFSVTNRGSLPTTFVFTTPEGYAVEPEALHLAAGEAATAKLIGDGPGGNLTITGSSDQGSAGVDRTNVALAIPIAATAPYLPIREALALLALAAALVLLARWKPWRLRLTRA